MTRFNPDNRSGWRGRHRLRAVSGAGGAKALPIEPWRQAHDRKATAPGAAAISARPQRRRVVSCTLALDHQDEIDGLICESFAFQIPAPGFVLSAIKGLSHVAPKLGVLTLKMKDFTRDPVALAALEADPLTKGESQPAATVAALVRADERLHDNFEKITLPVLILHGTDDKATVCHGSEYFHEHAGSADKSLKIYQGHYHDLLNDIGKEGVLEDIVGWIEARLPETAREPDRATVPA
jgi:alpha-beta hydrolase superfamily lysophospholipase